MASGSLSVSQATSSADVERVKRIRLIYVISIVLWTIVIVLMRLLTTNFVLVIVLLIPYALFTIAYINAEAVTAESEGEIISSGFISFALVFMVSLLGWLANVARENGKRFISILIIAIVLNLLSFVNVWVSGSWLSVSRRLTSSFQTMSLALVIYALLDFYWVDILSTSSLA